MPANNACLIYIFRRNNKKMNLGLAKSDKKMITISQHTKDLLKILEKFCAEHPLYLTPNEAKLTKVSCKYHDVGKYYSYLQNFFYKILNLPLLNTPVNADEVYHELLSLLALTPDLLKEYNITEKEDIMILFNAILMHHGRPPLKYNDRFKTLLQRIADEDLNKNLSTIQTAFPQIKEFKFTSNIAKYTDSSIMREISDNKSLYHTYVKVKGLLNRVDYSASAGYRDLENKITDEKTNLLLCEHIKQKFPKLRDVQEYMYANSDKNLVVVASTGIGKTEAYCYWIKDNKGFITLPLKVAINANYDRLHDFYGFSSVSLLHSDMDSIYLEKTSSKYDLYEAKTKARLLRNPITVTTVDQLFKFVFKYHGSEITLSTLAYSKVIIDELQMYSPEIVACILYGLKMICDMGGKFAIVTATLPQIFVNEMQKLGIKHEPVKQFKRLNEDGSEFIQHRIALTKSLDYKTIMEAGKHNKVLVIANTVKKAQELYDKLSKMGGCGNVNLLHARYIYKDRKVLENSILAYADKNRTNDEPGIWISTNLVEASLDIDFDVLYTELCSIDSLLQRTGRVFRHRQYKVDTPNIFILTEEASGLCQSTEGQELLFFTKRALESLFKNNIHSVLFTEDIKQRLIALVYDPLYNPDITDSVYYKMLRAKLRTLKNITPYEMTAEDARKKFRDIYSVTVIPHIIYEGLVNNGTIAQWEQGIKAEKYIEVKNEIKDYALNIPGYYKEKNMLYKFPETHKLEHLTDDIYICMYQYDFDEVTKKGKGLILN